MSPSVAEEAKPAAKVSATCGTEHMILVSFQGGGGGGGGGGGVGGGGGGGGWRLSNS